MYGNGHEMETLESLLEDLEGFESDESDESDEARRRSRRGGGRRSPVRTAPGTGLQTPRPNTQYVTQTQLQTSLAKVGAQIKTNSDAIKSVSDRVSAQTEVISREVATRKKETDQLKKDLNQTRQMSAILPLLSRPSSVKLQRNATDPETVTAEAPKVLVESGDTLSTLLPLMLMGGTGGSTGGSGGGMFGGDDSGMMMLVLALTLSKKP